MSRLLVVSYQDSAGVIHPVKVTPAVARALETTRRNIARSDQRWKDRTVPLTEFGALTVETSGTAEKRPVAPEARLWEGPRLVVRLFVGDSLAWPVPALIDGRCGCCRDERLPGYGMCMWCNRTGIDGSIEAVELAEELGIVARDEDGLAGGTGPATPAKVPKPLPKKPKKPAGTPSTKARAAWMAELNSMRQKVGR